VQRIVGGIEIEIELLRRLLMRLQEQIDKPLLHRPALVADLVIARWLRLLSASRGSDTQLASPLYIITRA